MPNGNIEPVQTAHEAAFAEALKEGGVQGAIDSDPPVGLFNYTKILAFGGSRRIVVLVHVLRVTAILKIYCERRRRERVWVGVEEFLHAIVESAAKPCSHVFGAWKRT